MNNTNAKKRPSHGIFQIIGDGDKARWIRVGAAWTNKDGKGFSLSFNSIPVLGHLSMRILPEPEARTEDGGK
jgi:hypothetical protein